MQCEFSILQESDSASVDITHSRIEDVLSEVCLGDPEAFNFCLMWSQYCHLVDDLIDVEERPTSEQYLEALTMGYAVCGLPFYIQHRSILFPVVLSVANAYADSVKWEKSNVNGRKTMADVLRCCGNEMLFMVAYICGGWKHQRKISSQIRERSWILHHDADDKPN